MYTLHLKKWHWPHKHDIALKFEHMVHDERFWPVVVALLLIAAFISLVIWAGYYSSGSEPDIIPPYPYY